MSLAFIIVIGIIIAGVVFFGVIHFQNKKNHSHKKQSHDEESLKQDIYVKQEEIEENENGSSFLSGVWNFFITILGIALVCYIIITMLGVLASIKNTSGDILQLASNMSTNLTNVTSSTQNFLEPFQIIPVIAAILILGILFFSLYKILNLGSELI